MPLLWFYDHSESKQNESEVTEIRKPSKKKLLILVFLAVLVIYGLTQLPETLLNKVAVVSTGIFILFGITYIYVAERIKWEW